VGGCVLWELVVYCRVMSDDALTLQEAAARLGRTYETVRRWVANGTLPAWRFGGQYRVRAVDVERLMRGDAA